MHLSELLNILDVYKEEWKPCLREPAFVVENSNGALDHPLRKKGRNGFLALLI